MYKLSFICKERDILHIWDNHWHPFLRASCVFNISPSGELYLHIYNLRDSLIPLIRTKQWIVLKLQILAVNYIIRLLLFFSIFYSFDSSLITTVMNGISNAIFIVVVKLERVSEWLLQVVYFPYVRVFLFVSSRFRNNTCVHVRNAYCGYKNKKQYYQMEIKKKYWNNPYFHNFDTFTLP